MPAPLYAKLGITEQQLSLLLTDLYLADCLSHQEIANRVGAHVTTIENWCRRLGIEGRDFRDLNTQRALSKLTPFTLREEQVLDGLILSDLHVEDQKHRARLSFGVKHLEFAESIIAHLSSVRWTKPLYGKKSLAWFTKSESSMTVRGLRDRWYLKNRRKIVPSDLVLSPEALYWWYLGDGYKTKAGAVLCTDAFTREENTNLVIMMGNLGIDCHLTPRNRIRIEGSSGANYFLRLIGPPRISCYQYKWTNYEEEEKCNNPA